MKGISDYKNLNLKNSIDLIEFETYLGPCNNFHGFEYTPYSLGYNKIIIETIDCECIVFNKYDIITL